MKTSWYIVQTSPLTEHKVAFVAKNFGFPVFFPRFVSEGEGRFRRPKVKPLFPGYVFIAFDITDDYWYNIYQFYGVRRILCHTGFDPYHPDPVSNMIVREIKERCTEGDIIRSSLCVSEPKIVPGSRVVVISGPLLQRSKKSGTKSQWLNGICLKSAKDRVKILLDLFSFPVDVPINSVSLVKG